MAVPKIKLTDEATIQPNYSIKSVSLQIENGRVLVTLTPDVVDSENKLIRFTTDLTVAVVENFLIYVANLVKDKTGGILI